MRLYFRSEMDEGSSKARAVASLSPIIRAGDFSSKGALAAGSVASAASAATTDGSGGSTTSAASSAGAGASTGGCASSGATLIRELASTGGITYVELFVKSEHELPAIPNPQNMLAEGMVLVRDMNVVLALVYPERSAEPEQKATPSLEI